MKIGASGYGGRGRGPGHERYWTGVQQMARLVERGVIPDHHIAGREGERVYAGARGVMPSL